MSLINFDIISCLINPKFLIPIENQEGQFNFSEIGNSINYLSALKVILVNFIIPFGFSFYVYFTTEKKNKIILNILLKKLEGYPPLQKNIQMFL